MWMRGHFTSVYIHVRTQAWVPVEGYTSAVAGPEGEEPSFSPPAGNGHVAVCSVVRRHAATAASASAFVVAACARRAAECYESHGCAAARSAVQCGCCLVQMYICRIRAVPRASSSCVRKAAPPTAARIVCSVRRHI
jgi:hypothetical protein